MQKISLLIEKLQNNNHLNNSVTHQPNFVAGDAFGWNHQTSTLTYDPHDAHAAEFLLHEFGHAVLGHQDYSRDITLLGMERAAWDIARELSIELAVQINDDTTEEALDTYRDWLHARSLCPRCGATGIQTGSRAYQCIACHANWRVNEARTCALRRYPTQKRP